MELPEDTYENELIDEFDALEPQAPASTKPPNTSPLQESANLGQPKRPKSHKKTAFPTIYPTFDDTVKAPEVPTPSKVPLQHEKIIATEQQLDNPLPVEISREELMSEEELQRNRRQIEREMLDYQRRFDHVAQVLAGETPQQIQGRKKREEERLERQEKRHEAMETRLQHQIERLEEREERRARIQAKHHRASRSPSPSSGREGEDEPAQDVGSGKLDQE
ncbi:hypothetical protein PHMEG_0008227 [Phytophthora megakarya]|uniref:Uncharacterized protein n=1 Tax=Phytophthora megakarya TaxID=4795 RepID=A0A225WJI2_9STRA|nr:hypothetical protein PHMEG_0008227 [Phytophthora megakarya]